MSVNPAASESSAANSCGARMPPQQCFGPLDLACLHRIENGQMFAAGLCDAFGGSCRTHRLMHALEVVLPAHRIVRKAAIRTRRQSLVERGVDAEPLVSADSGLPLMKHVSCGPADEQKDRQPKTVGAAKGQVRRLLSCVHVEPVDTESLPILRCWDIRLRCCTGNRCHSISKNQASP